MEKKINITSSAIEKGIDIAKDFLDKLIMPAVEETGLLIRDQVTRWRFNNQIKILNKTKEYCEKQKIDPKTISLKLLVPLLDYSGLEEDADMQDKWAILLGNMVDSTQNVENHVFPYILSQISKNEYELAAEVHRKKCKRIDALTIQWEEVTRDIPVLEKEVLQQVTNIEQDIAKVNTDDHNQRAKLRMQIRDLKAEVTSLRNREGLLRFRLSEPEAIDADDVKDFEISNLVRLGILKEVREAFANGQTLEIPNEPDQRYLVVDLEVDVESNESHVLTELGELFIKACSEKQ